MIKLSVYAYDTNISNRNVRGDFFPEKPETILINKRFIVSVNRMKLDEVEHPLFRILLNKKLIGGWDVVFGLNKELEEHFAE